MLNLFQSNQMTTLAGVFCERSQSTGDPFTPTTAIVQSFGIGQWLKLRLAEHQGIASNVDCILPATFLWQLYRRLIPAASELTESPFDRQRLTWRIMHLLRDNPGISGAVGNYLEGAGDSDLRLFQLSYELALLFDEYLMYRPEWPLGWEASAEPLKGHEDWQATLWRMILADLPEGHQLHRARLHQQTVIALAEKQTDLPWQHLSVFGLSTLPPLQLQTFEVLAEKIDVDIYFMNPCEHYWGDVVSEKDIARRSVRSLTENKAPLKDDDYLEVGNPLLSSLGKQGREYLELLLESGAVNTYEFFAPGSADTVLGYVKNDILQLTHGGEFGIASVPEKVPLFDNSLQVHICHSRMREVEVLRDEILRAMQQAPDLAPGDIMVMMPQVASYAPYIESVFSGSLPYRIADQNTAETGTLAAVFQSLVNLPASRLTANEVLDLLETPAVMKRFDLSPQDLDTMSRWVVESGIRWELNGTAKQKRWQLPPDNQHTWAFGVDRLVAGFAMSEHQGPWQGVLPYDIASADAELVGRLIHLVEQLASYREALSESRPINEWLPLLTRLLEDFLAPSDNEALELDQLLKLLEKLSSEAEAGGYEAPVSHQLVSHWLSDALSDSSGSAGFLSGGITFATLVPMRSIPFRMICLLGMNDGEFPREVRSHSFDLIAAGHSRKGDRSKRIDDRYLFLEALISAQDIFYCSYVGRGIRDNQEKPASSVLTELIEYLRSVLSVYEPEIHALQPFASRYYQGDDRASFDPTWFNALNQTNTTARHAPLLTEETDLQCSSISQLGQFLSHPARYFLRERLGVNLQTTAGSIPSSEPFELDDLEKFALADQALQALVRQADMAQFRQSVLSSGAVLAGSPGLQQLQQEINRAETVYQSASRYLGEPAGTIQGEIPVGNRRLFVRADNLHGNHLVQVRVGRLNARQQLPLWVQHLGVCALNQPVTSVSIHRKEKDKAEVVCLPPIEPGKATELLAGLLNLFELNLIDPLFLPPMASRTLVENLDKGVDAALEQVRREWMRDDTTSEGRDREWQRLFTLPHALGPAFVNNATAVWQPLLEVTYVD